VSAGAIPLGTWLQFSFLEQLPATGCQPDDPDGLFCEPSSAGNSLFLGPAPWTFSAPPGLITTITVTDAFESGDRFQVLDFASPIADTSPAIPEAFFCGSDPAVCLLSPEMSSAVIEVDPGPHSITILPLASTFGAGSAYLRVDVVPEPAHRIPVVMALVGLGTAVWLRRRGVPNQAARR
jgi:hypothetical protein